MTLQTEILSTETSDFLKQLIFLKSFNSVLALERSVDKDKYRYTLLLQ